MSANPYESPLTPPSSETGYPPAVIWDDVTIHYDLTLEDYIEFNLQHQLQSPAVNRLFVRRALISGSVGILMALVLIALPAFTPPGQGLTNFSMLGWFILVFFLALTCITLFRRRGPNRWATEKLLRGMFTQGDTSTLLGPRRFRVAAGWITDTAELHESRWSISTIQRIVVTPRHAFVYVTPVTAFLLPLRCFSSPDDFARFIANLEGHTGKIAERINI